jgi:hypothetical protein
LLISILSEIFIMTESRYFNGKVMGAFKFPRVEPSVAPGDILIVIEHPSNTYEERLHVLTLG